MTILYENLTIAIDKEGDIYRAYAFNSITEENVASCKCTRPEGAISGLFEDFRNEANRKAECENYVEFVKTEPEKLMEGIE
jgi:hypothetical protein